MPYMPVTFIPIESPFGVTIQNLLYTQESPSTKLMTLLPGRGYTCERPALHYLRVLGLAQGYDVLEIRYGFHLTQVDLMPENIPDVNQDGTKAVIAALEQGYEEVCIVGKSLGTPIAALLSQSIPLSKKSTILLTPIRDAAKMVGDVRTLAVIGTADGAYDPAKIVDTYTLTWKVYEGLNHGLEHPGDVWASLNVMREIMQACDNFLESL